MAERWNLWENFLDWETGKRRPDERKVATPCEPEVIVSDIKHLIPRGDRWYLPDGQWVSRAELSQTAHDREI